MLKGLALIGTGIWLLFVVSKAYAGRQRLQNSGFTRRYPHVDTLFGIDLLLQVWRDFHRGQLAEGMRRRHERYGETFITTELGSPCVYTIDPENIRTITTSQFEDFGKSSWVGEASKHVGAGILLNQGEAWKQSKTLLKPIFAHSTFGDPVLVEPHFQQLAATIRSHGGRQVDFQDLAAGFMLDTVSDFLFGSSTGCLDAGVDSSEAEHFLACIKAFEPPSGMFMAVGALAWIELLPSYRRLIRVVNGMKSFFANRLDAIISSDGTGCVQSSSGTSCFRMMKTIGVPVAQIQAELKNIYFASFDTSTALLSNVVEILASRPAIQQRLRDEIAHLGDQAPGRNDLAKVRYLRYVILEALRLYSPVTSHSRRALVDTTLPRGGGSDGLGPVTIAKGTTIIWSTYALNRSPKHYGTDWAEFRPERWEELEGRCSHFFMPFGSGPRICMGQQMAQAQLAYVIVRLLQNFSAIESSDSRPFREAAAVSFYNGNGTLVSLRSQWR